jgi:hypothetical protein
VSFRPFCISCILAALAILPAANAGTIVDVNSGLNMAGTETNSLTGGDVILPDIDPSWAPNGTNADGSSYVWISYADTGYLACPAGGHNPVCPVNTTISGPPTDIFTKTFNLPYDSNSGSISFWADDTAAVFVDGTEYIDPIGARASHCTANGIGCMANHDVTLNFGLGSGLIGLGAGEHTIQIDAYQLWGAAFGVMYGGEITSSDPPVPEPSTYLLAGLGMFCLAIVAPRLRKRA